MRNQTLKSVLVAFSFLLLSGCGSAPESSSNNGTVPLNVNETVASTGTVAEPIYLNNCGSSANAEQVSEHSQTISIEGAAQIGMSIELAQASVAGKYVTSNSVRKSQTVIASPGTNMKFVLLWTEQVNEGVVTVNGYSGQATYRVSVPISVEQVSAENLGCSENSTDQTNSGSATEAPTINNSPTSIPPDVSVQDTPNGTILDPEMAWHTSGSELILKNTELDNFNYDWGNVIVFELIFINQKPNDISFKYMLGSNISAVDNYGNTLKLVYSAFGSYAVGCDQEDRNVKAGDLTNLSCTDKFAVVVDTGNPNITEAIITVSNISSINKAQWRIPIYH